MTDRLRDRQKNRLRDRKMKMEPKLQLMDGEITLRYSIKRHLRALTYGSLM